jgi:hypothetical protein
MIYFALSLWFCIQPVGCQWIDVNEYLTEAECLEDGAFWSAEGGEIAKWKCVVKVRKIINTNQNVG